MGSSVATSSTKKLRMPWSAPPSAPMCPACKVRVYPAEAVMAADRKPFHKKCVKCVACGKGLTPATLNEHETQLYCNVSLVPMLIYVLFFQGIIMGGRKIELIFLITHEYELN